MTTGAFLLSTLFLGYFAYVAKKYAENIFERLAENSSRQWREINSLQHKVTELERKLDRQEQKQA
jgi:CHASE1-domain containing sensor protein